LTFYRPRSLSVASNIHINRWHSSVAREPAVDEATAVQSDMVKEAVKELLQQKQTSKTITFEQLQQSHQNFQTLLKEARLCIADCDESRLDGQAFLDESNQASEAVEDVYAAYLDMLDDFRGCKEEDLTNQFGDVRQGSASDLKLLRKELDKILQEAPSNL